jgi:hypothetical protein
VRIVIDNYQIEPSDELFCLTDLDTGEILADRTHLDMAIKLANNYIEKAKNDKISAN